ncbi:hypothetical protein BHE74_00007978 [Ensete ventricosum]|nr:hypothetical protein BHE74_00007978 [Ensete ventricosum]
MAPSTPAASPTTATTPPSKSVPSPSLFPLSFTASPATASFPLQWFPSPSLPPCIRLSDGWDRLLCSFPP